MYPNKQNKIKGIRIFDLYHVKYFEYFYMVVMAIYMAQMTTNASRMFGGLSGNPIPLLLPVVLTLVLLRRNKISWSCPKLGLLCAVLAVWSLLVMGKNDALANTADWSYTFFLFYAVIVAFIHVRVYDDSLFPIYEHIMTWICKISLPLWLLNMFLYHSTPEIIHHFPETGFGNCLFSLYNWMDPLKEVESSAILRNSGCSWEPGRFAIMIAMAIYANLLRKGVTFRRNRGIFWLLAALLTTQSTTGYTCVLVMYALFILRTSRNMSRLVSLIVLIPVFILVTKADFMQDKIMEQADVESTVQGVYDTAEWADKTRDDGEYIGSLNRFQAMFFERMNIKNDPWLGYSRNKEYSYFNKYISTNLVLTGGILKVLGEYGIPIGIFLYLLLLLSSIRIAKRTGYKVYSGLFVLIILSSVSYVTWCVPVFTAFWLYGVFMPASRNRRILSN